MYAIWFSLLATVTTSTVKGVCEEEKNLFTLETAVEQEIAEVTHTTDVDLATGSETGRDT